MNLNRNKITENTPSKLHRFTDTILYVILTVHLLIKTAV